MIMIMIMIKVIRAGTQENLLIQTVAEMRIRLMDTNKQIKKQNTSL